MEQPSGRQHTRIDYRVPIELLATRDTHAPRRICGHSLDLSEGGARIVAPVDLSPGDTLTCAIPLDGRPAHLSGRVVWVDSTQDEPAGLGIRWDGLGTRDSRALRHIIDRAREGYRRAELHFEGIEQPVFARAKVTEQGVRLSVALPILDDDSAVSFRLDTDAPLLHGQIGDVRVEHDGTHRTLRIDVDEVSDPAVRYRRHTQYGQASELHGLARRTPDVTRVALPDGTPIDLSAPLVVPKRNAARWTVVALTTCAGIALGWTLGVVGGAFEGAEPAAHVVTPAAAVPAEADEPGPTPEPAQPPVPGPAPEAAAGAQPEQAREPQQAPEPPQAQKPNSAGAAEAGAATADGRAPGDDTSAAEPASTTAPDRPAAHVDGETVRISIPFEGTLEGMRSRIWADPLAIALDLPASGRAPDSGHYRIGTGGVRHVRLNRRGDALLVRVMLERPVDSYSVNQTRGELQVHIARRD